MVLSPAVDGEAAAAPKGAVFCSLGIRTTSFPLFSIYHYYPDARLGKISSEVMRVFGMINKNIPYWQLLRKHRQIWEARREIFHQRDVQYLQLRRYCKSAGLPCSLYFLNCLGWEIVAETYDETAFEVYVEYMNTMADYRAERKAVEHVVPSMQEEAALKLEQTLLS